MTILKQYCANLAAIFLLAVVPASCKSKKTVLPGIKEAPAGNYLKADSVIQRPDTASGGSQANPPLQILKNKTVISGKFGFHGALSVRSGEFIQMDSAGQIILIHISLPKDMHLPALKQSAAILSAELMESPGPANRFLHIAAENKLVLGYQWQSSVSPLVFAGPDKFLLRQVTPKAPTNGSEMVSVPVEVLTDNNFIPVPAGKLINFKKSGVSYQVFVIASIFQNGDQSGDNPKGYTLNVVITKM